MAVNMSENKTLDYALRALQVIFAIIIMGTDGYGTQNQCILLCQCTVESNPIT